MIIHEDRMQNTSVYIHEVGHALGLGHPHETVNEAGAVIEDILPGDSMITSVMSYILDVSTEVVRGTATMNVTPAIADIEAIHELYGIEEIEVNGGDTIYGFSAETELKIEHNEPVSYKAQLWYDFTHPSEFESSSNFGPRITIYDTGGADTLDFSNEGPGNPGEQHVHNEDGWEIINWLRTETGEIITNITTEQRINLNPGWTSNVYGRQANLVIANDTIIENVIAGAGNDEIIGNEVSNRLEGRDGNDELYGRGGNDDLRGGNGNDVLEGGVGADSLQGNDGSDTVSYQNSPAAVTVRLHNLRADGGDATGDIFAKTFVLTSTEADGTEIQVTVSDIENIRGSAFDDTLAGTRYDNVLDGLGGNDSLYGGPGGGDDTLRGGPGQDRLYGGVGDDILEGGAGADELYGGPGSNTLSYESSPAGVTVRLHSEQSAGGDAEGDMWKGRHEIKVVDQQGNTVTENIPDMENLIGSAHDDILAGDARNNTIFGGSGNDALYGGPGGGDDIMNGNKGNDRLFGGQGNDKLYGSEGNDRLSGGPGEDIFIFEPGEYENTITDFTLGEDKIDLSAFDLENIDELVFVNAENNKVTLDSFLLNGVSVILENLTNANISEDHFIL